MRTHVLMYVRVDLIFESIHIFEDLLWSLCRFRAVKIHCAACYIGEYGTHSDQGLSVVLVDSVSVLELIAVSALRFCMYSIHCLYFYCVGFRLLLFCMKIRDCEQKSAISFFLSVGCE